MTNLKNKVTKSFKWSIAGTFLRQALSIVFSVALARLLAPELFGYVVIANISVTFLILFINRGMEAGIIQRDASRMALSTIFWVNLGSSLLLYLALFLCSELIAKFFQSPPLISVLHFVSVKIFLEGVMIVPRALLSKSLNFKFLTLAELSSTVLSGSVALGLALLNYGIYSLIWQTILQSAILSILVILGSGWKPTVEFKWSSLGEMKGFRSYFFLDTILTFFSNNLDQLLIGKYLTSYRVGIYNKSLTLVSRPFDGLAYSLGKVLFPSLSMIKDNNDKIKSAYLQVIGTLAILVFPVSVVLFILTDNIVLLLLGDKWTDAIPLVEIFCLLGIVKAISPFSGNLYVVKERTDLLLLWGTVRKVFIIICIVIGLNWGAIGVAWFFTISKLLSFIWIQNNAGKLIDLSLYEIFKKLWISLVINAILLVSLAVFKQLLSPYNHITQIASIGFVSVLIYVVMLELFGDSQYRELKRITISTFKLNNKASK